MPSLAPLRLAVCSVSFACAVAGPASAQFAPGHPPGAAFVRETWTVDDGLPVNGITHIVQARDGYLWLGTWDGLVRFDGVRFTVFNTSNTDALPSNRIVNLVSGGVGDLWFQTEPGHLIRVHDGEFTNFATPAAVTVIYADDYGHTWFGTRAGVRTFDGERLVDMAPAVPPHPITALLYDRRGNLWAGTAAHGVYRVRDGAADRFDTTHGLPSSRVTALAEDGAGDIWIGTDAGLVRFDEGRLERIERVPGEPIRGVATIHVGPKGDGLWVRGEDGLLGGTDGLRTVAASGSAAVWMGVDSSGAPWHFIGSRLFREGGYIFDAAPGDSGTPVGIRGFLVDAERSIWVGADNGLHRLKPAVFRVYGEPDGLAHRRIGAMIEDRSGDLWVGTLGGGLSRIAHGGTAISGYLPADGYPHFIHALMQDRRGDLWVGGGASGVMQCELPAMRCRAPAGGSLYPQAIVHALHEGSDGTVWAGSEQGLFRLRNGVWEAAAEDGAPGSAPILAFLETRDGTLWIGTAGEGLLVQRKGRISRIGMAEGLPGDFVRAIHRDGRGYLWVGTEGRGLARLSPDSVPADGGPVAGILIVRQRDGLFDEVIHAIVEDDQRRLWLSSNRGIFRVSLDDLDAFAEGRSTHVRSTSYTERDGLRNREANGGNFPAGFRARDGRIWFATQDGAAVVDPAGIRPRDSAPPVTIETLSTHTRTLRAGAGEIGLHADERDFEIDYTALTFDAPDNVRFRYRLEGLAPEWTEAGGRRTAFYTNVPPGRYTFRVLASGSDGVWNEAGASVRMRVAPYFHETPAAYGALLLTAGLLALGGFRWRLRSLRLRERELTGLVEARTAALRRNEHQLEAQNAQLSELNEARSRLFANLSHEFRTPLTLILGPLQGLLDGRHGSLTRSARDQHDLMLRNGKRLLRLINQILDLSRLQAGAMSLDRRTLDLVGFVRASARAFASLAERRGVQLTFHADVPVLPLGFDPEQLEKVLLNLLSNALKFTERGGVVEVRVDRVAAGDGCPMAEIVVRDTGCGIAHEQLVHVFERFFQADTSATRRYEGTGIGLALAKELVDLHHGTIHAESAPGAGSTFTVRLPIRPEHAKSGTAEPGTAPPAHVTQAREIAGTGLHAAEPAALPARVPEAPADDADDASLNDRTTVLVVDDNADVREFLRMILAPSFAIIEAGDGRAGLEIAQAELPDLIIADVMMPEMDGLALGRALKRDPMTDAIPLILLTARAAPEDHVAGLDAAADAYLVKPFDPAVLEACVANLIAQRRRLRERFRSGDAAPPTVPGVAPSELETRLRAIITAHLHDPGFGPETLAAAATMSYHKLYRALRDELDITPSRFIRTVRAECAAELLRQGAGTVTEIAYSVGFESLSYFRRAFRERFGTSPTDYIASGAARPVGQVPGEHLFKGWNSLSQ